MRPSVARALLRPSARVLPRASARGAAPRPWQMREPGAQFALSPWRVGDRAAYSTRDTSSDDAERTPNKNWRTTLPFEFPPEFGFVFDIDGVLLRSSEPVPGAAETIQFLQDNKIPYALLTNGGGAHEVEKATDVGAKLGVTIPGNLAVLSHTPFRDLVHGTENLQHKNVFVTGSDPEKCREIAESYGFTSVITPADILKEAPDYFPHDPLMAPDWKERARPLPRPIYKGPDSTRSLMDHLAIDAVLVFNEPRDWALNIQIIIDLMMSYRGVLGSASKHNGNKDMPNMGYLQNEQPRVYLSNPDLVWSTAWHRPRLGMGAFNEALLAVWKQVTDGADMFPKMLGKPNEMAYAAAEAVLSNERLERFAKMGYLPNAPLERVYMVGDNPMSDIRGANSYQSPNATLWNSILVCTGLSERYNRNFPSKIPIPPLHRLQNPSAVANDVREAVRWAMKNEGLDVRDKL